MFLDNAFCKLSSHTVPGNGANTLYGYCHGYGYIINNPMNRTDPDGTWSLPNWAKVAIGVAVIAVSAVATVATAGAASGTLVAAVHCAAAGALQGAVVQGTIAPYPSRYQEL